MRLPPTLDVVHECNVARYLGSIIVSHLGGGLASVVPTMPA